MSTTDLLKFLMNEQREKVTVEDANRLIEKYEVDETGTVNLNASSLYCSVGK